MNDKEILRNVLKNSVTIMNDTFRDNVLKAMQKAREDEAKKIFVMIEAKRKNNQPWKVTKSNIESVKSCILEGRHEVGHPVAEFCPVCYQEKDKQVSSLEKEKAELETENKRLTEGWNKSCSEWSDSYDGLQESMEQENQRLRKAIGEVKEQMTNGWSLHGMNAEWKEFLEDEIKPYWPNLYRELKALKEAKE